MFLLGRGVAAGGLGCGHATSSTYTNIPRMTRDGQQWPPLLHRVRADFLDLLLPAVCPDEVADVPEMLWEETDGDDVGLGGIGLGVIDGIAGYGYLLILRAM